MREAEKGVPDVTQRRSMRGSGVTQEQLNPESIPEMQVPSPASYDK